MLTFWNNTLADTLCLIVAGVPAVESLQMQDNVIYFMLEKQLYICLKCLMCRPLYSAATTVLDSALGR